MFNAKTAVWQWLKAEAESHITYPYTHPLNALGYGCSDQLIREVTSSGSHYFSRDTMRAFGTRLSDLVGGRFLIMSDRTPDGRLYRVGYVTDPSGEASRGGQPAGRLSMERSPFMATLGQAHGFARELEALVNACTASGVGIDELTRRALASDV